MPRSELDRKAYKKFLQKHLEEIIFTIIDKVIIKRDGQPLLLEEVITEAHAVLHARKFNTHEPENQLAWYILSFPIRVAVEFEFQRIHLVALVLQRLSTHSLDEFILEIETRTMQRMVA